MMGHQDICLRSFAILRQAPHAISSETSYALVQRSGSLTGQIMNHKSTMCNFEAL